MADTSNVKVYTVNGATAGSSSSLPDWLTRKRAAKGKRAVREHVEGTIELIQGFEFPEASNRLKTTRDGHHVIATGTYKPQMRVWDLDQLSLKFERHSDAENVDFVMLSDDWTKSVHLQNDRTIELHTQGGFHYRTRIPRFGRSLAYHFPSCDTYLAATGNEVYRLNLDQGRFMTPLSIEEGDDGEILGVNVVDINPVHNLLAFGIDGNGTTQFWDPRSRSRVGILRLPRDRLMPVGGLEDSLSVTAIASRVDGLSYALGTSTGHTVLYDIRAAKPFALKDQGYGLPVKDVTWIEGGSRMAGDGMVLSADKKVIKIWDRNAPVSNFVSITPASDLNDVHHVPGSGLLMTANEGIQMATYYIPQLGPAPRWASFLENITEEMEDQTTRSVYDDYKFVGRNELKHLGLDHLVGTPALKPYMHGYFMSLKLYDTARLIANPFAYDEYREKLVREKMEKMAETRIRSSKKGASVKVNKALAEKILKEEEKAKLRAEKKQKRKVAADFMDVDNEEAAEGTKEEKEESERRPNLLSDPRFAKVFEDPAFAIDENSREFALLNPSAAAQIREGTWQKTAMEEEEEESDKFSSDGLGRSDDESASDEDDEDASSDSSAEGELTKYVPQSRDQNRQSWNPTANPRARNQNNKKIDMVPMRPQTAGLSQRAGSSIDKNATFGQRRAPPSKENALASGKKPAFRGRRSAGANDHDDRGPMEISWVPSSSGNKDGDGEEGGRRKDKARRKGVETFGAGLEKGAVEDKADLAESERHGRTHRRQGIRSGSKNAFRRI
ncbi:WD repeat-containing protein [Gymnopilus junonius]|uniref:WD repeat-containing protein n=1 Tax=Gymnopilus junonius TaxID=109634 RepID=A0A9P5NMJ1_GYMJU|nr:WD repeat-containing protein [Gymnopilus junonius]